VLLTGRPQQTSLVGSAEHGAVLYYGAPMGKIMWMNCLSFAILSIKMLGFYALVQLFRELLYYNSSYQKHFFSAQNAPNVVWRRAVPSPRPAKGAYAVPRPLSRLQVGIKEGSERRRGEKRGKGKEGKKEKRRGEV